MRISELSEETGVAVATIKYYLREGLLHEGERTSTTQARYDTSHVARLRLIRALIGVGGLSVATARDVLDRLAEPPESLHELLDTAHPPLRPQPDEEVDTTSAAEVLHELGWELRTAHSEPVRRLAAALEGLDSAGFPISREDVLNYARRMHQLAEAEVAGTPQDPGEALRYVVLGTILVEPLLLALRRLAHIELSGRLLP
ncbi:MerR family transcriptional regulator [Saccharopolyspora halophila]|uniref:MerR family transcriptional regulator n=1 Tax=Saccharopolyspora halophila TaxID=405551 RepID=A0ABN3GFD7_9PSEU